MTETRQKDPAAVALGRKGGMVRTAKGFAKMTPERLQEIQRLAIAARARKRAEKMASQQR